MPLESELGRSAMGLLDSEVQGRTLLGRPAGPPGFEPQGKTLKTMGRLESEQEATSGNGEPLESVLQGRLEGALPESALQGRRSVLEFQCGQYDHHVDQVQK